MLRALVLVAVAACGLAAAAQPTAPASGTIIYKHVDESGRVTYANSPIKGGVRVELEPITVIPSTPSGSLGGGNAAPGPAVLPIPVTPSSAPASTAPIPVAKVVPVGLKAPNERITVKAPRPVEANDAPVIAEIPGLKPVPLASSEPASDVFLARTATLSPEAVDRLSEQRRTENRKRLIEGELHTEEQLYARAKQELGEEQRQSAEFRAMRAAFVAASSDASATPPTKEQRESIERHFERVRNLQDQVAMHENHLKSLRDQLASLR